MRFGCDGTVATELNPSSLLTEHSALGRRGFPLSSFRVSRGAGRLVHAQKTWHRRNQALRLARKAPR